MEEACAWTGCWTSLKVKWNFQHAMGTYVEKRTAAMVRVKQLRTGEEYVIILRRTRANKDPLPCKPV